MKGILEELKVPEGHTMLEYLGFMTPKAFENANLDPEKHMHLPIKIRRSTARGSKNPDTIHH